MPSTKLSRMHDWNVFAKLSYRVDWKYSPSKISMSSFKSVKFAENASQLKLLSLILPSIGE